MAIKSKIDGNSRISLSDDQLFDQSTGNTGGLDTTSGNTFVGYLAGQSVDAGTINNTFIGHGVGDASLANALSNVGLGAGALGALTSGDFNVAIGRDAGAAMTSNEANVIIGYKAFDAAPAGANYNVCIGGEAGGITNNAGFDYNVMIGQDAGKGGNAALAHSVAIGADALNSTADNASTGQIAIGSSALTSLTTGTSNVAVGYQAGYSIVGYSNNTCVGHQAGYFIKEHNNTAIGALCMKGGTSGSFERNVGVGSSALERIQDANNNVAIGFNSMAYSPSGVANVAIGDGSLDAANGDESYNIAIGRNAMGAADGSNVANCVAIGDNALAGAATYATEIAIGEDAMLSWLGTANGGSATAGYNIAIGGNSMDANTTGARNIAIGYDALGVANVTDNSQTQNVAIGHDAGNNVSSGTDNVIIGYAAGTVLSVGTKNVIIGSGAEPSSNDHSYGITIGYDCAGHADGSYMTIGTAESTDRWWIDYGTSTTWARESDERLKKNIENSTLGLDFVNNLRAVKYQWRTGEEQPEEVQRYNKKGKLETPIDTESINYGMIAQEVKSALDTAGVDDFGGWSENKDGIQALSVSSFVIPLIKAVQELSQQVEDLKAKIN